DTCGTSAGGLQKLTSTARHWAVFASGRNQKAPAAWAFALKWKRKLPDCRGSVSPSGFLVIR
ncbi:hypothetical protein, partial [Pseudomonas savastanoi]|uniref:hypothetical protein n=1 Tax=Pseudomonas savastanoi TaxID=29438 RepID=UPI001C822D53